MHGAIEIGMFHQHGDCYAYEQRCRHRGGRCRDGVIMLMARDVPGPDQSWFESRLGAVTLARGAAGKLAPPAGGAAAGW
jgi:hypothetical protein